MKDYIGTKLVKAAPMTRGAYNTYRGWTIPEDENPTDEGYLVEYAPGGLLNHPDHDGYISWSPKDVFVRAYRPMIMMTFGQAIEALKVGRKITREGWNGRGMYLYLVGAGNYKASTPAGREIAAMNESGLVPYRPYIAMLTVQGDVVPWVASQTDVLAEDWEIVL